MVPESRNDSFNIQPDFCIIFALALLIVPVRWVLGWLIAVLFHEACHYIAICLFNVPVYRISVSITGVNMQTGEMTAFQEIICALAGPLGGFLLLFFLRMFPYVSLCAFGQSVFNLLPIYPLDGGRVITGIFVMLFGVEKGAQIGRIISVSFSVLLGCICVIASSQLSLGVMPVILVIFLIVRTVKIPCKDKKLIVQ